MFFYNAVLVETPTRTFWMLYPELFAQLEKARWDMATDIPWDQFNPELLTDEQAQTIDRKSVV